MRINTIFVTLGRNNEIFIVYSISMHLNRLITNSPQMFAPCKSLTLANGLLHNQSEN